MKILEMIIVDSREKADFSDISTEKRTLDVGDFHLPENSWTYARNAINNTRRGDLGKLSNEPSNTLCTYAPYVIIGAIHIEEDRWAIFSTNNTDSEIGEFNEGTCTYTTIVNDKCLKFNADNLIKGVSRPTFNCSFKLYWDDGLNPTRVLDIANVPWKQTCTTNSSGCTTCVDTTDLDCDKIRLESFLTMPCLKLKKGVSAGSLLNGTYQVQIAYEIDTQRVTDYSTPSNALTLFDHSNVNSSIEIELSNLDLDFENYQLVLISTISEKTVARLMGTYSTRQTKIVFDSTNPVYELSFGGNEKINCFSKLFNDKTNPSQDFAAIMVCSDAETNCPFIPDAALRISTTYDDPKEFDGTPIESEKYVERANQIAMECLYVFSKVI
jgi:hypothetical protein